MSQQDCIAICSGCTNREFNSKQGILCGLTHEKANFEGDCPDYVEDERVVKFEKRAESHYAEKSNLKVNNGRVALFLVGGIYTFLGVRYLTMEMEFYQVSGFLSLLLGMTFIALGVLSLYRASLALIIGLSAYALFVLLPGLISPIYIFSGIIWKIIIISWLSIGISHARAYEARQKKAAKGDVLDQI